MLKTVNDLVTKLNALAVRIANEFRLVKADIKQLKTQGNKNKLKKKKGRRRECS